MHELNHLQQAYKLAREAFNSFGNDRLVLADSDFDTWSILYKRFRDAEEKYINAYNAMVPEFDREFDEKYAADYDRSKDGY